MVCGATYVTARFCPLIIRVLARRAKHGSATRKRVVRTCFW